jgi:hypothetical protein
MTPNPSVVAVAVLLAGAFLPGCSSTQPGTQTRPAAVGSHNVLTEAELKTVKDLTVYETVQRLRPNFFRSRQVRSSSTPNPEPVHVFVDGSRTADGVEILRHFTPQQVKEMRFYEPHEANVRFGTGHHGGVLALTLFH